MPARSKARKRALDIVFEADLRNTDLLQTLADWQRRSDPPVQEHAARLVTLVADHAARIDTAIADRLVDWSLPRVAPVDRAILRVATAELLWADDVPDAVVIDEGIELAKSLSTDDSAAFVNGVLARVAADKMTLLDPSHAQGPGDALQGVDAGAGSGLEDAPSDQPLGELTGTLVVDHRE